MLCCQRGKIEAMEGSAWPSFARKTGQPSDRGGTCLAVVPCPKGVVSGGNASRIWAPEERPVQSSPSPCTVLGNQHSVTTQQMGKPNLKTFATTSCRGE